MDETLAVEMYYRGASFTEIGAAQGRSRQRAHQFLMYELGVPPRKRVSQTNNLTPGECRVCGRDMKWPSPRRKTCGSDCSKEYIAHRTRYQEGRREYGRLAAQRHHQRTKERKEAV